MNERRKITSHTELSLSHSLSNITSHFRLWKELWKFCRFGLRFPFRVILFLLFSLDGFSLFNAFKLFAYTTIFLIIFLINFLSTRSRLKYSLFTTYRTRDENSTDEKSFFSSPRASFFRTLLFPSSSRRMWVLCVFI